MSVRYLPPPTSDGEVLTLDSAAPAGIAWAPGGGGGGGTAASSVVAETSFGASSAVGVATTYARGDHTHGTPAAPTAASVGADPTGTAAAEVAAHEADADPHPQYLQAVDVPTWLVLGTDTANSTVTPADVADLTFTPAASTTYLLEIWLPFTTAASTTGLRWQVYDATGGTASYQTISAPASATTQVLRLSHCLAGNAALGTGTGAGGTPGLAYGWALIVTPASPAGDISIRFYSEVAGSAVTLKAGACVRVTVVP